MMIKNKKSKIVFLWIHKKFFSSKHWKESWRWISKQKKGVKLRLTGETTPRRPLGARVALCVSGRAHRRFSPVDFQNSFYAPLLHLFHWDVRVFLYMYARITFRIDIISKNQTNKRNKRELDKLMGKVNDYFERRNIFM